MNKKNTLYFVVSSLVVLFFVIVFIVISARTYSIDNDVIVSISNMEIPVGGRKVMDVNIDMNGVSESEKDKYSLSWTASSNSITLENSTTTLNDPNNIINAIMVEEEISVTVHLYYEGNDEPVTSSVAYINVNEINNLTITNDLKDESFTFYMTDGNPQLSFLENYDGYDTYWSSSQTQVLTIDDNAYMTFLSEGQAVVSAVVKDKEDNVIAQGQRTVDIISNTKDDDVNNTGGNENDDQSTKDFTLSSLSINPGSLSSTFSPTQTDYIATLPANTQTFRISAVATNGSSVIVKENGNLVSGDITWSGNSMEFDICVSNSNGIIGECASNNIIYKLIVQRESNAIMDNYLESLVINSEQLDISQIECNSQGDKLNCNLEYSFVTNVSEVKIEANTINGYVFKENYGPGVYPLNSGENGVILEITDTDNELVAVYYITILVPEKVNTPSSSSINNTSSVESDNPGTGDMSSFIIFMIMLMSLIASLVVYKRNIENN